MGHLHHTFSSQNSEITAEEGVENYDPEVVGDYKETLLSKQNRAVAHSGCDSMHKDLYRLH